jgi:hypothetical protein
MNMCRSHVLLPAMDLPNTLKWKALISRIGEGLAVEQT